MAIKQVTYNEMYFNISYTIVNNNSKDWILFLHGWGSNKELMKSAFHKNMKQYNHIYIDLPGFGNSSNRYILDSHGYAKVVDCFLKKIDKYPKMIIGHSFGGKIATILKPEILVLLSSAGIPKIKSMKVKIKILLAKLFKIVGLKNKIFISDDAKNLSKNMYENFKIAVNEDISEDFKNFNNKAIIIWGANDNITPIYMGNKINSIIHNSKLYVLNGDHFFFLNNVEEIDRIINE